jgi:hypothetical protein
VVLPDVVSGRVYTPEEPDATLCRSAAGGVDEFDIPFGEPGEAEQYDLLEAVKDELGGEPEDE